MKITILSDSGSWKNQAIRSLAGHLRHKGHRVSCLHKTEAVQPGDILFILGFFKIVSTDILRRHKTNIVVHESALPKGRGWSPVTWLVLAGSKTIPLTLFEAVDKVDAGVIYLRDKVQLHGHELLPEIHDKVGTAMVRLCKKFVDHYPEILKKGISQRGEATYYRKRAPEDSRLDPQKSIAGQFNLLRTVDNEAYPAFFSFRGSTYIVKIEKKV